MFCKILSDSLSKPFEKQRKKRSLLVYMLLSNCEPQFKPVPCFASTVASSSLVSHCRSLDVSPVAVFSKIILLGPSNNTPMFPLLRKNLLFLGSTAEILQCHQTGAVRCCQHFWWDLINFHLLGVLQPLVARVNVTVRLSSFHYRLALWLSRIVRDFFQVIYTSAFPSVLAVNYFFFLFGFVWQTSFIYSPAEMLCLFPL